MSDPHCGLFSENSENCFQRSFVFWFFDWKKRMASDGMGEGDLITNLVYTRVIDKRAIHQQQQQQQQLGWMEQQQKKQHAEQEIVVLPTRMKNARCVHPSPKLGSHGFELLRCPTALSKEDFYDDSKVRGINYPEIINLIRQSTSAPFVIPFHHQIRSSERAPKRDSPPAVVSQEPINEKVGEPASVIHCDYTSRNALGLFDSLAKAEHRKGRFIVINAWRNITDYPIPDYHLAMCDPSSVVAPDDFVPFTLWKPTGPAESYRLDPSHRALHRWYYYPAMVKDEVLLFMQYDSNPATPIRYTPHSSITLSSSPPKLPRLSLEMRCIAFFPDHQPSTIPDIILSADEKINRSVFQLIQAVSHPNHWPEDARNWMSNTVHQPNGIEQVLKIIMREGTKKKEHGLHECSPEQQEKILQKLLQSSDFTEIAKRNFPPLSSAPPAVNSIMYGLDHPDHWPPFARSWMASTVHLPGGARNAAQMLVAQSAKKGEHGLGGTTPAQQHEIVEGLMAAGFEAKAREKFPPQAGRAGGDCLVC